MGGQPLGPDDAIGFKNKNTAQIQLSWDWAPLGTIEIAHKHPHKHDSSNKKKAQYFNNGLELYYGPGYQAY